MTEDHTSTGGEPSYEIGHFKCTPENFDSSVPYIVCEVLGRTHYVLHADESEYTHMGVAHACKGERKKHPENHIVGGGRIVSVRPYLSGSSGSFGREPDHVRSAFIPLVIQKLREIGLEI